MNTLIAADARKEITERGWAEIQSLRKFLRHPADPSSPRYAASVVIRSETEFLSLSIPRFGIRFYLDEAKRSFVNCRRLELLTGRVGENGAAPRRAAQGERNPLIYDCLGALDPNILSKTPCIADGLLTAPPQLHKSFGQLLTDNTNFHIIRVSLGKAYGETEPSAEVADVSPESEESFAGTPYVKTVAISGGLCAQASCFVATAILNRHASGVFGLAEITALIQEERCKELAIGGLTEEEMCRYFEKIGLRSVEQFVRAQNNYLRLRIEYPKALRAYLRSNMPVILMVDSGAMQFTSGGAKSIYQANGWTGAPEQACPPQKHAVVLVGCGCKEDIFLFHDCSGMPFMAAKLEQLDEVGYFSEDHKDKHRCPVALSVTPRAVTVPLLQWIAPGSSYSQDEMGLLHYSLALDLIAKDPAFSVYLTHSVGPGEFFLVQLGKLDVLPSWLLALLRHDPAQFSRHLSKAKKELTMNYGWLPNHWLWVEVREYAIRIWNAELPLPPSQNRSAFEFKLPEHLPVTIKIVDTMIQSYYHVKQPKLELSLISSFTIHGMERAAQDWPRELTKNVELYAFMQRDLKLLFPGDPSLSGAQSVVQALGSAWRRSDETGGDAFTKQVAQSIEERFQGLQVRAFATFVPEILADREVPDGETAQNALRFLVRLGRCLGKPGQPFTIEVVSGGMIESVWRARMRDRDVGELGATLRHRRDALNLLLSRLAPVAVEAAKDTSHPVQLAVELEPGPLFNLNGPSVLRELCEMIEGHSMSAVRAAVGINLDIAHWAFLSRIHPFWLELPENRCVRERVIHCHVSDHSCGHLSDNFLGAFHWDEFADWMHVLASVAKEYRSADRPCFSGLVSLELEACRSIVAVKSSLQRLEALLLAGLART